MPKRKKVNQPTIATLADTMPESFDPKTGTVDVVLAGGDRFLRFEPALREDGPVYVQLGTDPGEVRLGRLNSGRMNLLNNHGMTAETLMGVGAYDVENVLGVFLANSARHIPNASGGAVVATCLLSTRDEVAGIRQDIAAGVLRQVSPGVRIFKWAPVEEPTDGSPPTYRAVDWEPFEVSLTAVPAQAQSYLLSENGQHHQSEVVSPSPLQGVETVEPQTVTASGTSPLAQTPAAPVAVPVAAPAAPTDEQLSAATLLERERVVGITTLGKKAGASPAYISELIGSGKKLNEARELLLDRWATSAGPQEPAIGSGGTQVADTMALTLDAMRDAIVHRGNQRLQPLEKLSEQARGFVGFSLMDLACDLLERRGTHTRGRSRDEIMRLSLHATGDFPLLLANSANKTLRDQYDVVPRQWQSWARQGTLTDFKSTSRAQLGGAPALDEVPENGAVPRGTIGEQAETIQLKSYGKAVGLSRQMMINDDLGAFLRIPAQFGVSAATLEDDLAYSVLTANANMADAVALFHATHKNLSTGAGSALAIAGLAAAQNLMRQQTGLDGKYLNLSPAYVILPSALEVTAKQILVQTQTMLATTSAANINVFLGTLTPIVQPRLDAVSTGAWYLVVNPTYCDTVEVAFLAGQSGPRIETRLGFDVDGMEIKCMHDVAAKAIDWRGIVKSNGS